MVAQLAGTPAAAVSDRSRLLMAGSTTGTRADWSLAGVPRPAVGPEVQCVGGSLYLPRQRHDLRPHVGRWHVRGPDGEPDRSRDLVGSAQLRPQRPRLGPGAGEVRDRATALPRLGHL